MTSKYSTTANSRWYYRDCFCDLDKPEPTEPETNQPDPEPPCVKNAFQPLPKDSACGAMGNPTSHGREEIGSATATSVQGCRDACHKTAGRDSFQLEEGFNCYLFKGKVGTTDGRTTDTVWCDMSCFCGLNSQPTNPKNEEPTKDVCIGEPLNPLPANTVCGKPGDVDTNTLSNKHIKTDVTLAECYKAYNAASDCDVFNFHNQRCELYKTKGRFAGTSVAFTGSTIQWWQPSCFCDDTKTDPKDPGPVCVNNMLSPQPKNSNCGAKGSILTEGISLDVLDWGIESFSFMQENFCIFFATSVGPTDGSETEHAYYDMSCFCDSNFGTGD